MGMTTGDNSRLVDSAKAREIGCALLAWYDVARRDLPWRKPPGVRADPYAVWLSEIMLQQTTVKAVAPFFGKFLRHWPDVGALASADLDDVLSAWAGLGYYSRARNLHRCARLVVEQHRGRFPSSEAALRELPGIGPYTAAAIAAIAFDKPAAAVDGNVERVVARLFAVETPLPEVKPELRRLTGELVPEARPGDFAQAMMDLGATICTVRTPDCGRCPLAAHCRGQALGIAAALPVKPAKGEKPVRKGRAFVAFDGDRVLLRRRAERGLLGGMMEVPSSGWSDDDWNGGQRGEASSGPIKGVWRRLPGQVRHTFTHFHLEMDVYLLLADGSGLGSLPEEWRWVSRDELETEALPSLMRKVLAHAHQATEQVNA